MAGRATTRARDAGVLLALAALALLFWKLRIIDPAANEPFHPNLTNVDFFTYELPVGTAASASLRRGELPLWNPNQSAGHPFLASIPFGVLYPLNFAFLLLPGPEAIEATVIVHLIAAGAFVFLWARAIALGRAAAAVAAITFMLGGFVSSRAVWFTPALAAAVWLPLAFLAIEKIFRGRGFGAAVLLAVAIAMPILAGWMQTWTYSMYAIALYAGARLAALAWRRRSLAACARPALGLAAAGLLGVGLAAVQLLPSFELQALTPRRAGDLSARHSLLFGGTPARDLIAEAVDPEPGPPRWDYLGLAGLVLLPLSLGDARLRLRVACLGGLAALGLGVALGVHTPIFAAFQAMPTGSWFRNPQRILFLYAFAGSLLVGIGAEVLLGRRAGRAAARWWLAPAVATLAALALAAGASLPGRGLAILGAALAAVWGLAVLPAGRARTGFAAALVFVVAIDLFLATRNPHQHPFHRPEIAWSHEPVMEFLRARQGQHRTYIHDPTSFDFSMPAKKGTLAGIYSITDYEPLSLERTAAFLRPIDRRDDATLAAYPFTGELFADPTRPGFETRLDLFGVRFIVAKRSDAAFRDALSAEAWRPLGAPGGGAFFVYERRDPLPRAYVAYDRIPAEGAEQALAAIAESDFDPRRSVVLESASERAGTRSPLPIAPARILSYRPTEVAIDCDAAQAGSLVLSDTFYPGWEATLDGKPVETLRANALFRAVPVGPGRHRVQFRFRPASVRLGAGLSLASLAVIAGWVAMRFLRRRRSGALLALALAAAAGLPGCDRGAPPRPDVVVVVVDTLRRDRLGIAGNAREASPRIDALAREGVLFEEAVTAAPRTWQSFTSILTGLYPPHHGVRAIFGHPLPAAVPSLGSLLAGAGYQTAAFDGMTFLREMTGGHAFQEYVDPRSLATKNPMLGDALVMDAFLAWLEGAREPFFAFLRLSAPHWTYACEPVFHGEVAGHAAIDHRFNAGSHGLGLREGGLGITDLGAYRERFYGYRPTPAEREHMVLHYDECVHTSDAQIGRAVDRLRERGVWDRTLMVVTSDHGESFGEHGYLQHGPQVDGPVMRVPLVIRFPDPLAAGRRGVRVPQLVRTVDLLPTIAAALELPAPPGLDGTSLLPALDEGRDLSLRAYGEAGRAFVGVDRDVYLPGVAGKWRMLRTRDWKLIHIPDGKGGIDRLYDLRRDPGETVDVAAEHPEQVALLRRELDPILAADAGAREGKGLSEAEKERLRALGYL